jgi:hypothetical protein
MQTEFTHRTKSGLTLNSAWTWAKNLGDAAGPAPTGWSGDTGGGRVTNSMCRACDRGNIVFTRRHRWLTSAVYDLPFGRGRAFGSTMSRAADAFVGGWRFSGILVLQTGPYFSPTMSGGDPSGTNAPSRGTQRPDAVGTDPLLSNPTAGDYWNVAAFVCPGRVPGASNQFNCNTNIGRFGNAGVGTLLGPGTVNLNSALGKEFRIKERAKLKFEASFTDVLNHVNLADPGTNITSISFGVITTARGADSGGNRVGSFALRFEY